MKVKNIRKQVTFSRIIGKTVNEECESEEFDILVVGEYNTKSAMRLIRKMKGVSLVKIRDIELSTKVLECPIDEFVKFAHEIVTKDNA